ncbi:DJ-1/PfpI family protein [Agathobacter rectalis]|uniref:DJ-1/PfpI family protein n=1 Tax=Agathobacter rectalis TaxID=39491 RepID=UPI000D651D0D|nr:DJ-1/PfpI family protein [Agathobacter rectalis]
MYRNETNRITYVDVCGFDKQRKIIASVCVAALPIGKAGVLEGRNATTYHLNNSYRQKELAEFGVNVMNEPIVVDKNIITSYSPQTANDVAFIMLERLLEKRKLIGLEKGVSG